jgi:D-sedoheptulose 7-phosphate isomerase
MNKLALIQKILLYKQESCRVLNYIDNEQILNSLELLKSAYYNNKKVLACGNGGNAGLVANLIADFNTHIFVSEDKHSPIDIKRWGCINLCESGATLTGITNDLGGESIFSEQIKNYGNEGDTIILISGSGTSKNIVKAFEQARLQNITTITITKNPNCYLYTWSDIKVLISGDSQFPGQIGKNNNNFHFEDCVCKLTHIWTGLLKDDISKSTS